jgi:hypothetical protein
MRGVFPYQHEEERVDAPGIAKGHLRDVGLFCEAQVESF